MIFVLFALQFIFVKKSPVLGMGVFTFKSYLENSFYIFLSINIWDLYIFLITFLKTDISFQKIFLVYKYFVNKITHYIHL